MVLGLMGMSDVRLGVDGVEPAPNYIYFCGKCHRIFVQKTVRSAVRKAEVISDRTLYTELRVCRHNIVLNAHAPTTKRRYLKRVFNKNDIDVTRDTCGREVRYVLRFVWEI
jgi:hypothetical protein